MCTIEKCPVPFDQQPLNEYRALKKSYFFKWPIVDFSNYIIQLCYIFFILFLLSIPIATYFVPRNASLFKIAMLDLILVNLLFLLIFLRLYLGWSYIVKRLISATIFYEESGWYDGQIWIKSIDNLMQDRLVGFYEVLPFVVRVKYSLIIFAILFLIDNTLYLLL